MLTYRSKYHHTHLQTVLQSNFLHLKGEKDWLMLKNKSTPKASQHIV